MSNNTTTNSQPKSAEPKNNQCIVLAFDIERSGAFADNHTIGIGASVVDSNFKELDRLFLPGYSEKDTNFEKRCWDEFWVKIPDRLKELTYNGPLTYDERQKEMVESFLTFRDKWAKYAVENNVKFELASDNNVYDGGFINQMIFQHTKEHPIPYLLGSFSGFWESHSMQRGLLFAVDPTYTKKWGFTEHIRKLYDVNVESKHTHNPADDAHDIAVDMQILFGIRAGTIKRR